MAFPKGSGYPLYLFKPSLRGVSDVAICKFLVPNIMYHFLKFKKDAVTIPNAVLNFNLYSQ